MDIGTYVGATISGGPGTTVVTGCAKLTNRGTFSDWLKFGDRD
jgi:hypothetical protein